MPAISSRVLVGHRVADGVGDVQRRGARARGRPAAPRAGSRVRARGVLGRELDVVGAARGASSTASHGLLQHLARGSCGACAQVDVGGGDEGVDAPGARRARRACPARARCPSARWRGTAPAIAAARADLAAIALHGLEVAGRGDGKPASITSTPRRSSWRAMRELLGRCSCCSPATARRRAAWCRRSRDSLRGAHFRQLRYGLARCAPFFDLAIGRHFDRVQERHHRAQLRARPARSGAALGRARRR